MHLHARALASLQTHGSDGEPLAKNAKKKLEKRYGVALAKHTKVVQQQHEQHLMLEPGLAGGSEAISEANPAEPECERPQQASGVVDNEQNEPNDVYLGGRGSVKCGTFGNRQGLRVIAEGGPFCHTLLL